MSFEQEEPSYLGVSPRRPLPTTSLDHADLLAPMGLLDLSDAEDDATVLVDSTATTAVVVEQTAPDEIVGADREAPSASKGSLGGASKDTSDNGTSSSLSAGGAGDAIASSLVAKTPTTNAASRVNMPVASSTTTPTSASSGAGAKVADRAKRPPSPAGGKKAAGRVVASRYMSEVIMM